MNIEIHKPSSGKSAVCEVILRALPEWFGIETAIQHYVEAIDELPTVLATQGNRVVGFLTLKQHSEYAAEIYVMGILPEMHRRGIGQAMLAEAETYLGRQGIEYLQVKTLSPSRLDEYYAQTRAFYQKMGFRSLEELPDLWGAENPCLLMIKRLD